MPCLQDTEAVSKIASLQVIFIHLATLLGMIAIESQQRNKRTRSKHSYRWQFFLGMQTNTRGFKNFETHHNFIDGISVNLRKMKDRPSQIGRIDIWNDCQEIIQLLDPEWAGMDEEYAVSVSRIDSYGECFSNPTV